MKSPIVNQEIHRAFFRMVAGQLAVQSHQKPPLMAGGSYGVISGSAEVPGLSTAGRC